MIYRVQSDDEWRLVINHQDYETYDYIENLRSEEGVIKFDARNRKGKWTEEEFYESNKSVLDELQENLFSWFKAKFC